MDFSYVQEKTFEACIVDFKWHFRHNIWWNICNKKIGKETKLCKLQLHDWY